jgi:gliding motility-associated-like protein
MPAAHTSYVVSVTDSLGCTRKDTVLVRAPVALTTSTVPARCFGSATGSALAAASQGTGPFNYSWNTTPIQTTANATLLLPGAYIITATDTKGCTAARNISITSPPVLNAGIASTDSVSCNGGNDGKATAIVAGGALPYTYSWNTTPVQTGRIATGLSAGLRIVTVTDSNGCADTGIAMVPQPLPLQPVVSWTAVLCKGGSTGTASVSTSGGTSPYTFSIDAGSFSPAGTFTGLNAGAHTIHLKDAKGCTRDTSIQITEPAALAITYTSVKPLCIGGSNGAITIAPSGGVSPYQYAFGAGSFGSNQIFNGLNAGAYVLHVRDSNGCTSDSAVNLTQPTALAVSLTINPVLCNGGSTGSVTITVSGGTAAYSYAIGNSAFGGSGTFTGLSMGTYALHLKDVNGCTKDTSASITEPPVLALGYTSVQPTCTGIPNGSLNITGSGGIAPYQYALNSLAFGSSGSYTGLPAGIYTLHLRDAKGCTRDSTITLTQPSNITATTTKTNVSCFGGSNGTVQVAVAGGSTPYTYAWTGTTQTTASVTSLSAGLYTVTVTDSKGCMVMATANVTQPATISAAFSSIAPVCNNTATGSATVIVSGGTPPYSYSWLTVPVRTTATANLLNTGSYSVTITDAAGCILTAGTSVPQTPAVIVTLNAGPVSCFGKKDGSATAIPSGSTSPYTYLWNTVPVQTGATAAALAAGSYTATVTSAAGCVGTGVVTVPQPAVLTAGALASATCPGFSQGSILATVSGGNAPYSYFWNTTPVQTTATAAGLGIGKYVLIISDSKGCLDTAHAEVSEYENPQVKAGPAQEICVGSGAQLSVDGAVNYSWSPGASLSCTACAAPVATPLANTMYTVTGSDDHGCKDTDTVSIFLVQHVPLSVEARITICEGDSAILGASGGIAWQWLPATTIIRQDSTTAIVRPQSTTVYKVVITENRCFTDTLEQEVEVLPTPTVDLGPDLEGLMGATLQLNAVVTGASKISWMPATGLSCTDCFQPQLVVRGKITYIAEVQNDLGCPATDTLNIRDICDANYFYFANTFTPNGDGQNDRFYPQGVGMSLVAHFMIYDRWGEIVFSANNIYVNDPAAGWDGTFRNQALKPDVYVYVMDAVCETGKKVVMRGDITLIR